MRSHDLNKITAARINPFATVDFHGTLTLRIAIEIRRNFTMDDRNLSRLIELAKGVHMNDTHSNEQPNRFVYGNTRIENNKVTRKLVEDISRGRSGA